MKKKLLITCIERDISYTVVNSIEEAFFLSLDILSKISDNYIKEEILKKSLKNGKITTSSYENSSSNYGYDLNIEKNIFTLWSDLNQNLDLKFIEIE